MKPLREVIGDAAADCPSVSISGDVYALGDAIIADIEREGFAVVRKEPTQDVLRAVRHAARGLAPAPIYRAMLATKEEGSDN